MSHLAHVICFQNKKALGKIYFPSHSCPSCQVQNMQISGVVVVQMGMFKVYSPEYYSRLQQPEYELTPQNLCFTSLFSQRKIPFLYCTTLYNMRDTDYQPIHFSSVK